MPILKHEERIGAVLAGRFRIDAILGRGGMGVVFKGEELESGRAVAIKLLNYEYAERPEVVSRFIREANMMRDLAHPNIVGVYDLGQDDDGTVYLVLEFLDGQSLGDRLAQLGVLGVVEAADVLLPVMDALSFAHESGVVHRDLKPDNIFITRDSSGKLVPKLLDFGIAKTIDKDSTALTQTGYVLGTPEYMSPEQAQGTGVAAAADIYSMGVVFYECLSGALPTGELEGAAVLVATATGRTTPLAQRAPWLPKGVVDCVQRALAVDPSQRFVDMRAFAAAMAHACGIVRKSGEIRAPEGTQGRRKTQMGLRDPKVKASSPSLVAFHEANAFAMGPVSAAGSSITAQPASSPSSRRSNALLFVGAAVLLLGLGAGGALAFARKQPDGASSVAGPTLESADAAATHAQAEADGSSAPVVEHSADNAAVADASAMGAASGPRVRPRGRATQEPSNPVATGQPTTTGQGTASGPSNPSTTPARTTEHTGSAAANSGATTTVPAQRATPSANTPLSEYE
ncbi:MAG: protein kinase [Polyangiales bacterium]